MTQPHEWEGATISNRLSLGYDDRMNHWVISGREDHQAAQAEPHQLALAILENVPDPTPNLKPMDPLVLSEHLPPAAADLLRAAHHLALQGAGLERLLELTDQPDQPACNAFLQCISAPDPQGTPQWQTQLVEH